MSEPDEEKLAKTYNQALKLEKAGRLDEAAAVYAQVLAIDPDDRGGASIRMASMGRGPQPQKAPDLYVETLFDQHADVFDNVLVEQLGYAVPAQLRQLIGENGIGPFGRVLDLGCGTGLSGGELRTMARFVAGVDISENMVALACERDVYDELYVGEALQFLQSADEDEHWDLICATDVMPYLGALEPLVGAVVRQLAPGGWFAFSTETLPDKVLDGRDFMVGPFQRFAHGEHYVRQVLSSEGLAVEIAEPITVRYEQGRPIAGHLVLAKRTDR